MSTEAIHKGGFWGLEWRIATVRNGMKEALAYRGEFLLEMVGSAIVPVSIQLMLWYAVMQGNPSGKFAGMSYQDLIAYTWTSLLFSQVRGGDYDFSLIEMIRTGTLSNFLLRPVGPVEFLYFKSLGEKSLTVAFCFGLGLLSTFFTDITPLHLTMGLFLALLGNIIGYLFGATLAAIAFYWENAFAALMVKNMMVALLCGELIPLSVVPEKYSFVWRSTPFDLFVYGPAQVALGKWDHSVFFRETGIACLWIAALSILLHLTWRISIRRYQGLGG